MAEEKKRLSVTCPCCDAELTLEPETGLVLKSQPKKLDYSIEEALQREKERKDHSDDLFAAAFQNEKDRKNALEEKFKKAFESKDELEDPDRPFDWD